MEEFTAYDMVETETHLVIYMDIPGMTSSAFTVSFSSDSGLSVAGEREAYSTPDKHRFVAQSRHAGPFAAQVTLPEGILVDDSSLDAEYADGVLRVVLRKTSAEPRVMTIMFEAPVAPPATAAE